MKKHVTRAILLNDNNEVLLGKRVRTGEIGKWGLFGGKLDIGETIEECVIREVKEELNVDFVPVFIETMEDLRSPDDEFVWDLHLYYGRYIGTPTPKLDETSALISVTKESMSNLEFAYNHREILERFFATVPV